MPSYATINTPVQQAVPGYPTYLLGTYDYSQADVHMTITNVALTSNVATISVTVGSGNIPLSVGQKISVQCSNSIFNVSQAAITASTIDATTGIGTVSYAVTHADVVSVAATGRATALVPEVGETLANVTSAPVSIQANTGANNGRDIRFEVILAGGTPTATVAVQSATNNIDSEYVTESGVSTSLSFSGAAGTKSYTLVDGRARFYRFVISSVSGGTSPTIVAKVLC